MLNTQFTHTHRRRVPRAGGVWAAALAALLLLGLTACGTRDGGVKDGASGGAAKDGAVTAAPEAEASPPEDAASLGAEPAPEAEEAAAEGTGFMAVMAYLAGYSDVIPGPFAPEDQAALTEEARAEGVALSFEAEGVLCLADPDDPEAVIRLYPNGEYQGQDGNGAYFAMEFHWPDNDLGRMLPPPAAPVLVAYTRADSLEVYFDSASYAALASYGEALREAGFTETLREEALPEEGIYVFCGANEQGWAANAVYSSFGAGEPFAGVSLSLAGAEPVDARALQTVWPRKGPLSSLPSPSAGSRFCISGEGAGQAAVLFQADAGDFDLYREALIGAGYTESAVEDAFYYAALDEAGVSALVSYSDGTLLLSVGVGGTE